MKNPASYTRTSDHPHERIPQLRIVAWELTRACVLSCRHCRACATRQQDSRALSTRECRAIIDSLAEMGTQIVILTGGEPLMRDDVYDIARYGTRKGLRMALATCGVLLDEEKCTALQDAGIQRISMSLDGASPQSHDAFRGITGAYDGLMQGIDAARKTGLSFQINTTITTRNAHELFAIHGCAEQAGAVSFHPFLLVPMGRGSALIDEMVSARHYERILHRIYELQMHSALTVKPTCAPQYYRVFRQREHMQGRAVSPHTHGFDAMTRGCLGGTGFAFISHTGIVQACGFLEIEAGNLRTSGYDMATVWRDSPLFGTIRNKEAYRGTCGCCEYHDVCGGCRARAYAVDGDYMTQEPQCLYQPHPEKKGQFV